MSAARVWTEEPAYRTAVRELPEDAVLADSPEDADLVVRLRSDGLREIEGPRGLVVDRPRVRR
ncbi:MAG TPA: hypothetical protein VIL55_04895, partial [Naasia sp.]